MNIRRDVSYVIFCFIAMFLLQGSGCSGTESSDVKNDARKTADIEQEILSENGRVEMHEKDIISTAAGDLAITFVGHGTLMFEFGGKIIHVDPVSREADYTKMPKADLVLITHEHRDHLDPEAVALLRKEETVIAIPEKSAHSVPGATIVKVGDIREAHGVKFEAVYAYNIQHKRPSGEPFHPRGEGVGYVIAFADKRVYVAGDTENIPEMKDLRDIDIAFLPVNLPYTMTPEMAADAARMFRPKIFYPYHYGETDLAKLQELLADDKDIEVRIRKMK